MVWQRVLVPSRCVYDLGVSHAIYNSIRQEIVLERPSPIIFMRAQKNQIERENMLKAQILDGVAMCQAMYLIEQTVSFFFAALNTSRK